MYVLPTPFRYRTLIGRRRDYFIHQGYEIRSDVPPFDDTQLTDEFQDAVYCYAHLVLQDNHFESVIDVGCGSGFKLLKYFSDQETIGFDSKETVAFLHSRYPGRKWWVPDFAGDSGFSADLVICSDVIEHVAQPDDLLKFIARIPSKRIILSTPERDELGLGVYDGPPKNIHHVREWNFAEFHAYINAHFQIQEHFVVNGTQIVDCS